MIKYVNPNNIDIRIIEKTTNILKNGGIAAIPTDTSWSIVCSVKSKQGIEKLKKIKGYSKEYTFSVICSSISQISEIAELSTSNFKIIKKYTPGPFVFILEPHITTEKKINMKRKEIGVRIPNNNIPIELINNLKSPVFAITASRHMADHTWWTSEFAEENLFEFGWELSDINDLDIIIDDVTGEPQHKVLTTVISLIDNELEIIREGIGEFRG